MSDFNRLERKQKKVAKSKQLILKSADNYIEGKEILQRSQK